MWEGKVSIAELGLAKTAEGVHFCVDSLLGKRQGLYICIYTRHFFIMGGTELKFES